METKIQMAWVSEPTIPLDPGLIFDSGEKERHFSGGGKVIHKMVLDPDSLAKQRERNNKQIKTAAYCRVSTLEEEQHLSYETQVKAYTDKIAGDPELELVEIFADEGMTGTSAARRKEFMRMIKWCKQGKIELIMTKSVSRFARNTVDSLNYVRVLKDMGIGVMFEKENINTLEVSNELILTIYSSLAQAESESISGNVKWGKRKRFEQGSVHFAYKYFLGYRKGEDGLPEIVPEEAVIVREIYDRYLSGESETDIAAALTDNRYLTATGKKIWSNSTVRRILQNEKYMGDAILQKTYVENCISKKVVKNTGQIPKYYIENNHPAIIERTVWNRVQEEIARRRGKRKVKEVGTTTEQGKYSSKYALTEILICGECGTPYRRVTWNIKGKKKIVWRCINRLDYGKRYCKASPSIEETALQNAILKSIEELVHSDQQIIENLKIQIALATTDKKPINTNNGDDTVDIMDGAENSPVFIRARLHEIGIKIDELIQKEASENDEGKHDDEFEALHVEKVSLLERLNMIESEPKPGDIGAISGRQGEILNRLEEIKNTPLVYDEKIIRQMVECVRVISKEQIHIIFRLGLEVDVYI